MSTISLYDRHESIHSNIKKIRDQVSGEIKNSAEKRQKQINLTANQSIALAEIIKQEAFAMSRDGLKKFKDLAHKEYMSGEDLQVAEMFIKSLSSYFYLPWELNEELIHILSGTQASRSKQGNEVVMFEMKF